MDRDFLVDLFADFGPVTIRPMFSGFGISVDGVNFALSLRAGLYFRADEQTIPRFEAEGSKPFQYQTSKRSVTVASYWQLPARLFDDTEELSTWAREALGAARRAVLKKRRRGRENHPAPRRRPRLGRHRPRRRVRPRSRSSPGRRARRKSVEAGPKPVVPWRTNGS